MKQKIEKAKVWVKEHKKEIAIGAGTILVTSVGIHKLNTRKPKLPSSAFVKRLEELMDMTTKVEWQFAGSSDDIPGDGYKLSEMGKLGEDLVLDAKQNGIEEIDMDSIVTGMLLMGMKSK
jgi:hypothetical protein